MDITPPKCFPWNWSAVPLCREAACSSGVQLSFVWLRDCFLAFVTSGRLSIVLRYWKMISDCFLLFLDARSGSGGILCLLVSISWVLVFLLNAAVSFSRNFFLFSTNFNRVLVQRKLEVVVFWLTVGTLSWRTSRVAICLLPIVVKWFALVSLVPRLPRCIFFARLLIQSLLVNRSNRLFVGSQNHFLGGGLNLALWLCRSLKMGCWVQLRTENLIVIFQAWGILSLCSCVILVETFGKHPWFSSKDSSVSYLIDQAN